MFELGIFFMALYGAVKIFEMAVDQLISWF